jgi:hypothetical protein
VLTEDAGGAPRTYTYIDRLHIRVVIERAQVVGLSATDIEQMDQTMTTADETHTSTHRHVHVYMTSGPLTVAEELGDGGVLVEEVHELRDGPHLGAGLGRAGQGLGHGAEGGVVEAWCRSVGVGVVLVVIGVLGLVS